jgi:hypothetical protein
VHCVYLAQEDAEFESRNLLSVLRFPEGGFADARRVLLVVAGQLRMQKYSTNQIYTERKPTNVVRTVGERPPRGLADFRG